MRRDIFQAIADPTRRTILGMLLAHAMTPNSIAEHFECSRQAISKHLKILNECEAIKQDRNGRAIYYKIDVEKIKEIDIWISQFKKVWENRFDQLDTILKNI